MLNFRKEYLILFLTNHLSNNILERKNFLKLKFIYKLLQKIFYRFYGKLYSFDLRNN